MTKEQLTEACDKAFRNHRVAAAALTAANLNMERCRQAQAAASEAERSAKAMMEALDALAWNEALNDRG